MQRPPYGEQVLGVFAGDAAPAAFKRAAAQTGVAGRLTAFPLDSLIEANVSIEAPAPPEPTITVQVI